MDDVELTNKKCPFCHKQFALAMEGIAPEVMDKLMNMNWACDDCAELERKIAKAKERLNIGYDRRDDAKTSSAKKTVESLIAGQLTDLRILKKRLVDRMPQPRLNKEATDAPDASEGDFTLTG